MGRGSTGRRRIAIVYTGFNLDSVPSLTSTAVLLAQHGYLVDILTRLREGFLPPRFEDPGIAVMPLDVPIRTQRPWPWRYIPSRSYWPPKLLARHWAVPYMCVMGVDPEGLVLAADIMRWVKAPLAYYSLELLVSSELTTDEERALKDAERRLSHEVAFAVTQDADRASVLVAETNVPPERVLCIPNAPLGEARAQRSDYLHDKLGIPKTTKIMLHSGALARWSGAHQLMQATRDWPEDWVLVCHSAQKHDWRTKDYVGALEALAEPGRLIFSTTPLSYTEYPALVQSADIALAYYVPTPGSIFTQANLVHLGLSPGKVAYYLQAGVPIIATPIESLRRLTTTYGCGEIVEDGRKNREAIERILADYDRYSQNAAACFNQEFSFERHFPSLLSAIASL